MHNYPRSTRNKALLEALALQHGEPSKEELLEPAGVDDLQHAANWEAVVQSVESVNAKCLHGHFPLFDVLS